MLGPLTHVSHPSTLYDDFSTHASQLTFVRFTSKLHKAESYSGAPSSRMVGIRGSIPSRLHRADNE